MVMMDDSMSLFSLGHLQTLKHLQTTQRLSFRIKHQIILTTTPQPRIRQPRRLPIPHSTPTHSLHHPRHLLHPLPLPLSRKRQIPHILRKRKLRLGTFLRPIRLHNHNIFPIFPLQPLQTFLECTHRRSRIIKRIKRHGLHIIIGGRKRVVWG